MSSLRKWKYLVLMDAKTYLREPAATFFTLVFPALLLLLSGYSFGSEVVFTTESGVEVRILDFMLPATLAWVMAMQGLLGLYPVLTSYRETRVLKYFRTHPIRALDILLSQYVNGFIMLAVSLVLLLACDVALFGLRYDGHISLILVSVIVTYTTFFTLGFALAGVTPTTRFAQALGSLLFFPMMFLSGAFGPRDTLPPFLKLLSDLSPLTHATDLLMDFWFSGSDSIWATLRLPMHSFQGTPFLGYIWFQGVSHLLGLGYLILWTLVAALVALRTFRWDEEARPRRKASSPASPPEDAVVWAYDLAKSYGSVRAVDHVSFVVQEGEIFGVLGPNGAGKTTTLEILEGLRVPDTGGGKVLGLDPWVDYDQLVRRVGIQLQEASLPPRLKVKEIFSLFSALYDHVLPTKTLLQALDLEDQTNIFFSKLSGGQKQRVFAALALINDPKVVFLDEITTGLDAHIRRQIWSFLRELRREGKTILITTHYLEEAQALCDRVIILDQGRVVAEGVPEELVTQLGLGFRLEVEIMDGARAPTEVLDTLSEVSHWTQENGTLTIYLHDPADTDKVLHELRVHGIKYRGLKAQPATLEDVFLMLTSNE